MTNPHRSWLEMIVRIAAGLVLCTLLVGWGWDHYQQHRLLAPLAEKYSEQAARFEQLRKEWYEVQQFQGFRSWDDVEWAMTLTGPPQVFERLAKEIADADDAVYEEAIPKFITMLDEDDPARRQCAWRLLQCARKSTRFTQFEPAYRAGVVALLHHRSILAFHSLLPWLRIEKLNTPEVLAGLKERMLDDQDEFAPQAAYALAELDPTVDIAPRLLELIESKHEHWESILHRLPNYMPEDEAKRIFEEYRPTR